MTSVEKEEPYLIDTSAKLRPYKKGTPITDIFGEPDPEMGHSARDAATARLQFLEKEVDLLYDAHKELLIPGDVKCDHVLMGKWTKHPGTGLFVRAVPEAIVLSQDRTNGPLWFYGWKDENSTFNRFRTQNGMNVDELVMAAGLVTDFKRTLESYLPQYA